MRLDTAIQDYYIEDDEIEFISYEHVKSNYVIPIIDVTIKYKGINQKRLIYSVFALETTMNAIHSFQTQQFI